MKSRIDSKFEALRTQKRKALIPFFMPGAQGKLSIKQTILALEDNGADLVELGVPFSDPIADGPIIQKAAIKAIQAGIKTDTIFAAIADARTQTNIPILLLVYYNSIFKYGKERFVNQCLKAGVDGLIVPDLPFEEQAELAEVLINKPINLITLVARTSKLRMQALLPAAQGFIYCVSSVGVTGERSTMHQDLPAFLAEISNYTHTPRAVGFGISNPTQAKQIAKHCEGVIVGSALVRRLLEQTSEDAMAFIKSLRAAIDQS